MLKTDYVKIIRISFIISLGRKNYFSLQMMHLIAGSMKFKSGNKFINVFNSPYCHLSFEASSAYRNVYTQSVCMLCEDIFQATLMRSIAFTYVCVCM